MARFRPPQIKTILVIFVFAFCVFEVAQASPQLITFQSRIFKPNGSALEASSVSFRLSVTDPVGSCVIYQEDFIGRNMSGTKGLVTLTLGGGSKVFPVGPMSLVEVFNNYNFPSLNCQAGGSVTAGPADRRKVVMQFNDGTGWQTAPAMDINSNPFAMQALVAQKLGDYPANDYLRSAQLPTCLASESLSFNGTSIVCIANGSGTGTVTNVTSTNAYLSVATGSSTPALTLNVGTGANTVAAGDDSRITGAAQKSANLSDLTNAATARSNLSLGTAATLNVGTGNNNVVQLDGSARLPNVDGSQLTGVVASSVADNAITNAKLADNAVNTAEIADGAVVSGKIADGTITNDDINASAGIARSKIAASASGFFGGVVMNNATTGVLETLACTNGQIVKFNASGVATCGADTAGTGDIVNGGNTGAVAVGTNDATSLTLETNNAPALTILSGGNVGIGTVGPNSKLEIVDSTTSTAGTQAAVKHTIVHAPTAMSFAEVNAIETSATYSGTSAGISSMSGHKVLASTSGATVNHNAIRGISSTVVHNGTNSLSTGIAVDAVVTNSATTIAGIINSATAIRGSTSNSGTGWMSVGKGGHFEVLVPSGSISNSYGVYIGSVQGTTKHSLYASDATAPNYFAGRVGIGTNDPQRLLHVAGPMRVTPSAVPALPAAGDIYVDSADANKLKFYDGSSWVAAGSGGGGGVTTVSSANNYLTVVNGSSTPTLTVNVGTATNTVAAGDDSRITGAAQKSANLSDLTDASAARSNLSLGTAATLNVGTGNNNIVQLDGSARLPAVDGSLLTGVVASSVADNAITNAKLADNAVNTAEIVNGAVTNAKLAGSIERTKLVAGTNNHVIINDGSGDLSSEAQLAVSRGGTGANSFSANQIVGINGTGTGLISFTCGDGQVIKFNALGAAVCGTDTAGTGDVINGGNTGAVVVGTNNATSLTLETNDAPAMTILSGGNVGIGTATPAAKLDISGSIRAASDSSAYFTLSSAAGDPGFYFKSFRGTVAAPTYPLNGDSLGYIMFTNQTSNYGASIEAYAKGNHALAGSAAGGNLTFNTTPSGTNNTKPALFLSDQGNAGIQTRAPSGALSVNPYRSGLYQTMGSQSGTTVTGSGFTAGMVDSLITFQDGTSAGKITAYTNANTVTVSTNQTVSAQGFSVHYQGLNVDSTGNVGIGTTLPEATLDVPVNTLTKNTAQFGSFGLQSSSDFNGYFSHNMYSDGTFARYRKTGEAIALHFGSPSAGDLTIRTAPSGTAGNTATVAARLTLKNTGNFGIGTTTPERLLHTAGPMRLAPTALPGSPAAGDIAVDSGDSNKLKYYDGSGWVTAGGSIADNSITNAKLADNAVNTAEIADLAVTTAKINGGAITDVKIADNAVTNAKLAGSIDRTKLASGSNNHVLINDGSGVLSSEAQLAVSRGGTGLGSFTANALLMANGTGTGLTNATCTTTGEVLQWNSVSGSWGCASSGTMGGTGNTNKIPRFTASTTLGDSAITDDGTSITIERATNRVGNIGVAPSKTLDVGTGGAVGLRMNSGNSTIWDFDVNYGVNNNLTLSNAQTGNFIISTAGNVGIGAAVPAAKLHVATTSGPATAIIDSANASTYVEMTLRKGGQEYGNFYSDTSSNDFKVRTRQTTGKLVLSGGNGAGDHVAIDQYGNVGIGIGTTSAPSRFYVAGSPTETTGQKSQIYNYVTPNPASNSNAIFTGATNDVESSTAFNMGTLIGSENKSTNFGSGTISQLFGSRSYGWHFGSATASSVVGHYTEALAAGTAPVSALKGQVVTTHNQSNQTISEAIGVDVTVSSSVSGGTISNAYGLKTGMTKHASATITNGYGLFISDLDATNQFGIYQIGSNDKNYLNGSTGVGTNDPQTKLDVRGTASSETVTEGAATYVSSGASYSIPDSSLSVRRIDLTANTTLTLPAFTSTTTRVYTLTIFLRQDATGSRTVTWDGGGSTIKWDAGSAPTISATANKITIIQLTKVSDESVWYGSMVWKED